MSETTIDQLKKAMGEKVEAKPEEKPEKPKDIIRGGSKADCLWLNYSIPTEELSANKKLIDLICEDMSSLLRIASVYESFGVDMYYQFRMMLDNYLSNISYPAEDMPEEEEIGEGQE